MIDNLYDARKTVRLFLDDPVPKDDVDKIIGAAKKVPSKNCLYPYNIMALTNSEEGKKVKQHLCRNVCLTIWDIDKDAQYPAYDFDRNSITTPKIRMRQQLKQIEAPLTLAFVGQWISDRNEKDNFFTTKDQMDVFTFENLVKQGNIEIITRVIRDCMLSCSWAQLKAQELGYDTAFVGIAGQHENAEVNKNGVFTLGDYENIIILLCIGKEDETRWEGSRVQETDRRGIDSDITEVAFFEKHRKGEKQARGNPEPKIITI